MTLRIASDLRLPDDAITGCFGIVGQRGSGKSTTAKVLAEELAKASLPVVVLDPLGTWHGLRSSADGKKPGLPFVILGGEHGDVPLESTAGEVVADFLVDSPPLAVVDLGGFRKAEMRRFVKDLLARLYHRNRAPLHLVIDEADLFAPQSAAQSDPHLLGVMEDIVRRGRARGLGVTLITQRPAVISKDVLSQVDTLISHRLVGAQDRTALDTWVKAHGDEESRKQFMASVASLPTGTAWFWSPAWLDIFQKVAVRAPETFDSSATPKAGSRRVTPQQRADVDLSALKEQMAETIERAKADDPKALRTRIKELERELAKRPTETVVQTIEVVPSWVAAQMRSLSEQVIGGLSLLSDNLGGTLDALCDEVEAFQEDRLGVDAGSRVPTERRASDRPDPVEDRPRQRRTEEPPRTSPGRQVGSQAVVEGEASLDGLSRQARSMLQELADRFPMQLTESQWGTMSGYSRRSSSWKPAVAAVLATGLAYQSRGTYSLTERGSELLSASGTSQSPDKLLAMWRSKLPAQASAMLGALAADRGSGLTEDALAAKAGNYGSKPEGYSLSSSSWAPSLRVLTSHGLAHSDGGYWYANADLF